MSRQHQAGFAVLEAILILLVIGGLAALGFMVTKHHKTPESSTKTPAVVSSTTPPAPDIQRTGDLNKASQALDHTNVDGAAADTAELDAQLDTF